MHGLPEEEHDVFLLKTRCAGELKISLGSACLLSSQTLRNES